MKKCYKKPFTVTKNLLVKNLLGSRERKSFISTNIARILEQSGQTVRCLDCDAEEPNGYLFLKPKIERREKSAKIRFIARDYGSDSLGMIPMITESWKHR